jgi:hypothetical protein
MASAINLGFPSFSPHPNQADFPPPHRPHSHTIDVIRICVSLVIVLLFILSIVETSIYRCGPPLCGRGRCSFSAAGFSRAFVTCHVPLAAPPPPLPAQSQILKNRRMPMRCVFMFSSPSPWPLVRLLCLLCFCFCSTPFSALFLEWRSGLHIWCSDYLQVGGSEAWREQSSGCEGR